MKKPDQMILDYSKGMMTLGDWEVIHSFASNPALKVKVEIGTDRGLTTMMIARGWGTTYTIDRAISKGTVAYLEEQGIRPIISDSVLAATLFEDQSVDLLFIDGGHEYEQVKADYEAWYPKVRHGGAILFHDVDETHGGVWDFYHAIIKAEVLADRLTDTEASSDFQCITRGFIKP